MLFSGINCIPVVAQPSPQSIPRILLTLQTEICPCWVATPLPSFPSSCSCHSAFIGMNLTTLGTSYKRNHAVFDLCDWLILLSIMSPKVHPSCGKCQNFLPFKSKHFIACTDHLLLPIRPSLAVVSSFYLLAVWVMLLWMWGYISLKTLLSVLWIYARKRNCWIRCDSVLHFLETTSH